MEKSLEYIKQNEEQFIADLKEFIKIPSISCLKDSAPEVKNCAEWLKQRFESVGVEAQVFETEGHPIVYAEKKVGSDKPTILIYGHYDVMPVDPLNEWKHPPFEATIEGRTVYGRGTSDDKGQVLIHFEALKAYLKTDTELAVNLKFIFEGEEEIGSPNLTKFLRENKNLLKSDLLIVSDTSMIKKGVPTITYGLRGLTYLTIMLNAANTDMHSGEYGGAVENPIMVMCKLLSKLKDDEGKILIPGFYEKVATVSMAERSCISAMPFSDTEFIGGVGVKKTIGEAGFSTLERVWIRPTFDINGICGGFTEKEGAKTVIPREIFAKISMRLVPDQKPGEIAQLTEKYLRVIAPDTVDIDVKEEHGGNPWVASIEKPVFKIAEKVLEETFSAPVAYVRCGGSIPIIDAFYSILGIDCLLVGFGLPDSNAHAPNEKFDLDNYKTGIETMVRMYRELGKLEF